MTVVKVTGLPAAVFVVQIGGEQVQVTNVDATGTIWTIVRGFNGTTATAHANGSILLAVNPLFDLKSKFGLGTPAVAFNYRGAGEYYLQSSNGSNSANGGYYVLTPDGKLYAWNGISVASSPLAADLSAINVATTALTGSLAAGATSFTVTANTSFLFPTAPFVVQIDNEQIRVTSVNGLNNTWTVTRGINGTASAGHAIGATITSNVYLTPALLTGASDLPTVTGVSATFPTNPVTTATPPFSNPVTNPMTITAVPSFEGSVTVTVGVSDDFGATATPDVFTFTVSPVIPAIGFAGPIPVAAHNTIPVATTFNLAATDTAGAPSTPFASNQLNYGVNISNPLYDIQQSLGLTSPAGSFNYRNNGEWYLQSSNGSNPGGGNYYVLFPNGHLIAFNPADSSTGNLTNTLSGTVIDLSTYGVYFNPALLSAAAPVPTVLVNRGPLFDIQAQFGLTVAAVGFNYRNAGEWYLQSSNGSNPAGGGYYVLKSDGNLYAFDARDSNTGNLNVTFVEPAVANLFAYNVYANPSLLTTAQPAYIGDALYAIKYQFGLTTAAIAFNYRTKGEWYFHSSNGSNPAGGGYYVLQAGTGNLYAFDSHDRNSTTNLNFTFFGTPVASPGLPVYNNPALLSSSTGRVAAVTATVDSTGLVTLLPNAAFVGTVNVNTTASNGAEKQALAPTTYTFSVGDNAPTFTVLLPPYSSLSTSAASGTLTIPDLLDDDADTGDKPNLIVKASAVTLYDIRAQFGLNTAVIAGATGYRNNGEEYFHSSNGSNSAGGGYYVLLPNGLLYAFNMADANNRNLNATLSQAPVADLSLYGGVYATPSLLTNATIAPGFTFTPTNGAHGSLTLTWSKAPIFSGTFLMTVYISDGAVEIQRLFQINLT